MDLNWYGIKALQKLGLAWDVKLPKLGSARIKPIAAPQPDPKAAESALAAYSGD